MNKIKKLMILSFSFIFAFNSAMFFMNRQAKAACCTKYCWCDTGPYCVDPEGNIFTCDECGWYICDDCDNPTETCGMGGCEQCTKCCGGGCFPGETEIITEKLKNGETEKLKKIAELEPGEIVSSFNPETGEVSESQVADIHQWGEGGYYVLETESGKQVKVTGEHPFLAVKNETLLAKLKDLLSHTLTYQLITALQARLTEVWD